MSTSAPIDKFCPIGMLEIVVCLAIRTIHITSLIPFFDTQNSLMAASFPFLPISTYSSLSRNRLIVTVNAFSLKLAIFVFKDLSLMRN